MGNVAGNIRTMKTNNLPGGKPAKKSGSARKRVDLSQTKVRAALSNGSALLLRHVDGRLPWARRLRDLVADHVSDLGGDLSTAETVLVKRAAMLTLQLEMLECRFAEQDGMATSLQLNDYQRGLNTCRRTLEALGLQRRQKDVTSLGQVLREGHRHG
jgi:hypothetical protein